MTDGAQSPDLVPVLLPSPPSASMQPHIPVQSEFVAGKKRTRATVACTSCAKKKCKCSIAITGAPCEKCSKSGSVCELVPTKRGKYDRKARRASQQAPVSNVPPSPSFASSSNSLSMYSTSLGSPALSSPGQSRIVSMPFSSTSAHTLPLQHDIFSNGPTISLPPPPFFVDHMTNSDENAMATLAQAALEEESSKDKETESPALPSPVSTQTQTGSSSPWIDVISTNRVSDSNKDFSYLLKLCQYHAAPDCLNPRLELSEVWQARMLREAQCFLFPPQHVFNALLKHYLNSHWPMYPIFDLESFTIATGQAYSGGLSISLVWAILAVATAHAPLSLVEEAGFISRTEAMRVFSQRARLFISSGLETEKLNLVRAKLLLATIWSNASEREAILNEGHSFIISALSTAFSMQMHKKKTIDRLSPALQRVWKRVFWALFCRDKSSAAASGRPALLIQAYCDVPLPTTQDFNGPQELAHADLFIELTHLALQVQKCCEIWATTLLTAHEKDLAIDNVVIGFEEWRRNLPLKYQLDNLDSGAINVKQMHASMLGWLIHILRSKSADTVHLTKEEASRRASNAANSITRIFEELLEADKVDQAPQGGGVALFAAMCQHALDRSNARTLGQKALIGNKLANCKLAAKEMMDSRPIIRRWLSLFTVSTAGKSGTATPRPPSGAQHRQEVSNSNFLSIENGTPAFDSSPLPVDHLMNANFDLHLIPGSNIDWTSGFFDLPPDSSLFDISTQPDFLNFEGLFGDSQYQLPDPSLNQ